MDINMKLSMWMIANRLSSLDLELNIRESSLAVLKSARRVYATNCVHVYSDGKDAICSGEGDTIRIPDMDLITGFEIIQGVFDYFQDWMDQLLQMVRGRNYQGIIDLAWQVFRNPLILMDGNNRVLGLTRQYPEDALDEEWYYLCNYGYPSLNAILQMRADHNNIEFWQHGAKSFQFSENRLLKYIGRSYCMYCNDAVCGRITVLCKERELNPGDYQLLELIATLLEPSLGQVYYENVLNNTNVFYNLLLGNPYDQKQLCTQLSYQQWKTEDTFYLTMIEVLANDRRQMLDKNLGILMQVILYHSQDYVVMKKTPYILLLSNRNLSAENSMLTFLSNLETYNPIKISFSLPCTINPSMP